MLVCGDVCVNRNLIKFVPFLEKWCLWTWKKPDKYKWILFVKVSMANIDIDLMWTWWM
jgi:hypothetical protein